jgi:hypothetical protein
MPSAPKNKKTAGTTLDPALDLFGEIPVSQREVNLWLWKVPVWHTGHSLPRRREAYIRQYDVIGKIQRGKLQGTLQATLTDECCPHCCQPLEVDWDSQIEALQGQIEALRARPRAPVLRLVPPKKKPAEAGLVVAAGY